MDGKALDRREPSPERPTVAARRRPWPRSPHDRRIRPARSTRRTLLAGTAAAAAVGAAALWRGQLLAGQPRRNVSRSAGKKVIVIGIDGMDPRLSERMMNEGLLPNLAKLRAGGGFSPLGTSTPPQSPVAWANFINGAGPGDHGIFDFIHRHPQEQCAPVLLRRRDHSRRGGLGGRRPPAPARFLAVQSQAARAPCSSARACRSGTTSTPRACPRPSTTCRRNYPASPSHHGHHRCLCGMGTPDMLGTYGTYQHFAENGPAEGDRRGRRQAVPADVRGRDGQGHDRRARGRPAQDAPADRPSSSSSIATARPTRP